MVGNKAERFNDTAQVGRAAAIPVAGRFNTDGAAPCMRRRLHSQRPRRRRVRTIGH